MRHTRFLNENTFSTKAAAFLIATRRTTFLTPVTRRDRPCANFQAPLGGVSAVAVFGLLARFEKGSFQPKSEFNRVEMCAG